MTLLPNSIKRFSLNLNWDLALWNSLLTSGPWNKKRGRNWEFHCRGDLERRNSKLSLQASSVVKTIFPLWSSFLGIKGKKEGLHRVWSNEPFSFNANKAFGFCQLVIQWRETFLWWKFPVWITALSLNWFGPYKLSGLIPSSLKASST